MRRQELLLALCVISCLGASASGGAGEAPRKIRAAITSISGSMAPPWAAHEAGIFRKHGLGINNAGELWLGNILTRRGSNPKRAFTINWRPLRCWNR